MECIFQLTDDNKDDLIGVPQPYPASWFPLTAAEFEPPADFDPALMNWISCEGQYISVLAEDGVPFTHAYGDVRAPTTVDSDSYYMNRRTERPVKVLTASGIESRPAGVIGFKHSPLDLESLDAMFEWHDRDLAPGWGGAAMERALVRARMIEWEQYLLAVGGVVPTLTLGEANEIQQAELSSEFYMLRNHAGQPRMQIVTASFVLQGNTRTSDSTTERTRRASIRVFEETDMTTDNTTAIDIHAAALEPETRTWVAQGSPEALERIEAFVAALEDEDESGVTRLAADGTPIDPQADEIAALRAENALLLELTDSLITVDKTPLQATVETTGELRTILASVLDEAFATGDNTWVWVEDIDLDLTTVRYSIETAGVQTFWRDEFSFDAETHEATLGGAPVEIIEDRTWMDKDELTTA